MYISSEYRALYDQVNYILENFGEYNQYVSVGGYIGVQGVVYKDTIMTITRGISNDEDDNIYISITMNSNGNPVIEMVEEGKSVRVYRTHGEFRKIENHFYSIGEFNDEYSDLFDGKKSYKYYIYDTSDVNGKICSFASYPNGYRYLFVNKEKMNKSLLFTDIINKYDTKISKNKYNDYYTYFDGYGWNDE